MTVRTRRTSRPTASRSARKALLCTALAAAGPAVAGTDLTSLSLEQLMNLTVVGASKYEQKQSEVAAAVSIITRDEIRTFGWRTLDDALASLPGVYTTYDRQYSYLGMRGFGVPGDFNTRVLVTINGNRVNDAAYDGGQVGRQFPLDMDLVERIEFIPGPGGAVYGQNAMLGVVNVITRSGADVGGTEATAAYQHPQRLVEGRLGWGRRLDNGVDVLVSATGLRSRGEDRFLDFGASGVSGTARGLDGARDREVFARIGRGPWSADFVDGDHRKDDPTGAYLSDPLVAGQYQRDHYTLAQGRYEDGFRDDTLQVLGRVFMGQQRYSSVLSYGTPLLFSTSSDWRGGELRLLSTALAGHKLMLGVEAQDNARVEQAVRNPAQPASDILIAAPGWRVGVYAQDEWRLTDTLTTTLGLRADRNNITGTKLSPRAALIWQAAPTTTLKALYGRAHRAANTYERDFYDGVAQVANPALKGESIDTLELVADHRVGRDLHLRATAYRWTMRDLVTLGVDPASGLTRYESGDTVNARGVELSADKTWSGGARLRGSVSLQNIRYGSGAVLVNAPQQLAKLSASTPLPVRGLRLGYELRYDSRRRTLDGTDLGGHALSNLRLTASPWGKAIELSLGVRNLFDKRHDHPGSDGNWQNALAQDGRSVRVEARLRF